MEKIVLGLIERVVINGKVVRAKIDTGSARSSISLRLASRLKLGPIVKTVKVVSSHGQQRRPVILVKIKLKDKEMEAYFNITDRKEMKYSVLIGQDILKQGFLIDPNKDESCNN